MRNPTLVLRGSALLLLALTLGTLAAACSAGGPSMTGGGGMMRGGGMMGWIDQPARPPAGGIPEAGSDQSAAVRVDLEIYDWGFRPAALNLDAGVAADLVVSNTGSIVHGVLIPDLGVNTTVLPGTTVIIRINPAKSGPILLLCNNPLCGAPQQHAAMRATLTVA